MSHMAPGSTPGHPVSDACWCQDFNEVEVVPLLGASHVLYHFVDLQQNIDRYKEQQQSYHEKVSKKVPGKHRKTPEKGGFFLLFADFAKPPAKPPFFRAPRCSKRRRQLSAGPSDRR